MPRVDVNIMSKKVVVIRCKGVLYQPERGQFSRSVQSRVRSTAASVHETDNHVDKGDDRSNWPKGVTERTGLLPIGRAVDREVRNILFSDCRYSNRRPLHPARDPYPLAHTTLSINLPFPRPIAQAE